MAIWLALAFATPTLPVQGALRGADGAAVDGAHAVTFALYDVASGGAPLWSESATVSFADGAFAHALGSENPLDLADWRADALWIEITYASAASERVRVGAAARALYAEDAAALGGRPAADYRTVDWTPGWADLSGLPASSSALTSRIQALALDDESELTALLDDNYRPLSWVPSWSDIAGLASGSAALTSRIEALAYDTESELTALLDDNYARTPGNGLDLTGTAFVVAPSEIYPDLDARYQRLGTGNGIASQATAPTSPTVGTVYYDTALNALRLWDGNGWGTVFQGGQCGQSAASAAPSCKHIRDNCSSPPSGTYWLKPASVSTAAQAWCDMSNNAGGWTLCSNFVDTAGDDIVSNQSAFAFGGNWSGYNGSIPTNTALTSSSGNLNCETWAAAMSATQVRFDCTSTANSAAGAATWNSGPLTVPSPLSFASGASAGGQTITAHGEWGWGGYARGSWIIDDASYPNCSSNSCGFDGSRFASNINIELAGGYYSPGCASGCGSSPQNYAGAQEGASCGGVDTTGVAGERYSIWLR